MRTSQIMMLSIGLITSLTLLSPQADAEDINIRCNHDSLNATEALARLEWARYCGLRVNVGSPNPTNPAQRWDTEIPSSNGAGNLVDFLEDFGRKNSYGLKTYTTVGVGYAVNDAYISKQFMLAATAQSFDAQGFEKWSRQPLKARSRPMYPTFGTNASPSSGSPLYPREHIDPTDCNLYTLKSGGTISTNFYVNGYCTSSCYTPEQEILFPEGYKPILSALQDLDPEMITLTPASTLEDFSLQKSPVATYTTELWDTEHIIYEIRTESGGVLRVTDEHPLIQGEGRVVQAKHLRVGDELIMVSGDFDPIVSIKVTTHYGKVYNLKPASRDRVSNILVAQGYLVGSSAYQNEDVDYINRIIMFRSIPEDAIPQ